MNETPGAAGAAERMAAAALELVDHLDAMVAYWDRDEVCLFANRAYVKWFGKTRAEVIGTTLATLLGPLYAKNEPYIRAAYAGTTQVFERDIPHPDGRIRQSLATYTPNFVDGKVEGIFVHVTDVGPLKLVERQLLAAQAELEAREQQRVSELERVRGDHSRLQEALRRSLEEWHATFDSIESPLLLLGQTGAIHRCNEACRRELAAPSYAAILGRHLADLAGAEPWKSATSLAHAVLASERGEVHQIAIDERGQTWELTANRLRPATRGLAVVALRNITEVIQLQESLRRSALLSTVGALAAGVAHEVRNPLFAMSANLDCLEADRSDIEQPLHHLRREMARLERLMRGLLDYAKPVGGGAALAKVTDVIAAAIVDCATTARTKGVALQLEAPDDVPLLPIDAERLGQTFQNLIDNAVHFSPLEGCVRVAVAHNADDVTVAIEDDGPGFPPDVREHLFEPFYSRRRGGTGLGMAIANRIVQEHGGTIAVANRLEGGGSVVVTLPRRPGNGPVEPG